MRGRETGATGPRGRASASDEAAGQVELPVPVPFGFHGLWVDEADL